VGPAYTYYPAPAYMPYQRYGRPYYAGPRGCCR